MRSVQVLSDSFDSSCLASSTLGDKSGTCNAAMPRETEVSKNNSLNRRLTSKMMKALGSKQQGMTLLELTVVLLILTTLATIALRSTSGIQDQTRWEETRNRYEALKSSIAGNPEIIINGQPDFSGFIADMGRLPDNIKELLVKDYCDNDYEAEIAADCTTGTWITNLSPTLGCSDGISLDEGTCIGVGEQWYAITTGWNGPYLLSDQPSTEADGFIDDWGNAPAAVTDLSYGWTFDATGTPDLTIQSLGCSGCDLIEYDDDYPSNPTALDQDDWQIDISSNGITALITMPFDGTCNGAACTNPTFTDQASCTGAGATWVIPVCSNPIHLTKSACEANGATWTTPAKANCQASGQTWTPTAHTLSMIIRHRGGAVTSLSAISSNSPILNDDGQFHYVQFNFTSPTNINMGQNSIQIQEAGADFQHAGILIPFIPGNLNYSLTW